ncbi:tripartite tricarboxylate transporter substrate binding protein [Polaromonas sp. SM01]|uniref:Bug family tripartite tricarboxylate transporter substrate binding protein n=1 Tax=Polaromonas sp. SM01 TaxID=3085630 RepID=UPI0029829C07|nr:tripartite tricarboxylate transporter substrate binding protein [Polaromonas sp. SM01]MDW5443623.1 tripartite tricarboxylate transporter substrate binding protein [Polaromonas sp. SM01]
MNYTRRQVIAIAASLGAALSTGSALAQNYPSKPITLVVAYPAGGDTDAMARLYAEKLASRLGQPVIVDNRPGASGLIGSAYVAKAQADGYTLLLAPSTFSIAQLVLKTGSGSSYDVLNGFTPIVQTAIQPLFVAASTASGAKDLKELVAMSKTKPLSYASPGSGSPMHILGEMFNKAAGVKLSHVPYRGVAPAVNDVLGGHVPVTFMTLGPVAPHVTTGKVVVLAVADPQRSSLAPDVPTLAELGYKDVEVGAWQGLFGPKGLPADIVKTLNNHLNEILKMPDIAAKMATFGALPAGGEPSRLAKANAGDYDRFGKIIKEFGIQAD